MSIRSGTYLQLFLVLDPLAYHILHLSPVYKRELEKHNYHSFILIF